MFAACSARPSHGLGGGDRRARDQRGRLVHAEEGRVVGGAEAVPDLRQPGRAGVLDRRDVGLLVDEPQQLVVGRLERRHRHVGTVQDAERAGQRHRQLDAYGVHRMPGAEVVGDELLVPEDLKSAVLGSAGRDGSGLLMASRYRERHVARLTRPPLGPMRGCDVNYCPKTGIPITRRQNTKGYMDSPSVRSRAISSALRLGVRPPCTTSPAMPPGSGPPAPRWTRPRY